MNEKSKPPVVNPLCLGPEHDITAFCDYTDNKYALSCMRYDGERRELTATDSRALVVAKVPDGPQWSGLIPGKAVARLLKSSNSLESIVHAVPAGDQVALSCDGVETRAAPSSGTKWPDTDAVWPKGAPVASITLNPHYLGLLCEYASRLLETRQQVAGLELHVHGDAVVIDVVIGNERVAKYLAFGSLPK